MVKDLGLALFFFIVGAAHGWRTCLGQDIERASSHAGELVCRDGKFWGIGLAEGVVWFVLFLLFRTLFAAPRKMALGVGLGLFLVLAGITELRISSYEDVQVEVAKRNAEKLRAENEAKEMERVGVDKLLAEWDQASLPIADRFKRCEALANRSLLFRCLTGLYPKLTSAAQCSSLTKEFDRARCTEAVKARLTAKNSP